MQQQRLGQHLADGHARVERAVGVLEDELGAGAGPAQLGARQRGEVAAGEADRCRRSARSGAAPAGRRSTCRSPNSPTSASVSPAPTESETPSTARTTAVGTPSSERRTTKCFVTLSRASSGALMPACPSVGSGRPAAKVGVRPQHMPSKRLPRNDVGPALRSTASLRRGARSRVMPPAPPAGPSSSARGGRRRGRRAAGPRLRQRASANGQRPAKRQPTKLPARLGTLPEMVARRSRRDADVRDGAEQAHRVGVLRRGEQPGRRRLLDDLAGIHDGHVVAGLGHHAEVVGDEDDGRAGLGAQLGQQIEDLRLDGDVERRGRLVGDQQRRRAGERHGDHHALAHAAGELVGIFVDAHARRGDPDALEHVDGGARAPRRRQPAMAHQGLADLVADGEARIERGHRLLEDHGEPVAAQILHLPLGQGGRARGPRR